MADFFELLKTRRSIREFQEKEVPLALVQEIIRDSCMAPSSGNGQPWKFIIINTWILHQRGRNAPLEPIGFLKSSSQSTQNSHQVKLARNYSRNLAAQ